MLDREVRGKFKEFQEKTGEYGDLDIDEVRFEKIFLSNEKYFKFIKGKNKYIQRYIKVNKGDYPILGSSLKNNCISAYINPIEESDIVKEKSVTFNKDNAKGSVPFFRDYPYLMDRHHIAIIPNDKLVEAKYLEKALIPFFKHSKFGWGDNIADVSAVQKHLVPIPKDLNKEYTSFVIQKAIVDFLEYSFDIQDNIKKTIDKRYDIFTRLRKSLIPSTFHRDYVKVRFAKYAKEKGIEFNITDVEFIKIDFANFFDTITPPKKIKNKDAKEKANFPIVSQSEGLINGYTNEENGYIDATTEHVIIFGDHTTLIKYVNFKFFAGADGTKILKPKDKIMSKYAYYQSLNRIKQQGYQRHFQFFKKEFFLIPKKLKNYSSLEIQKIIADFIEDIDNELQLEFDKMDKAYKALERLHTAYLARTFTLIDWGKK